MSERDEDAGAAAELPFDAAIFDLDGTLVDSLADIGHAMNHALAAHGLPTHPLDRYRHFVGSGLQVLAEKATPVTAHQQLESLMARWRAYYIEHHVVETQPYPGIPELLAELRRAGLPIAVLSNKPDDLAVRVVSALFDASWFVDVRGQRQGVDKKPDPTAALEIAAAMSVPAERCAFVGDTPIDMQTAARAAMFEVAVLWGFRSREELVAAGAGRFVARPADVMTLR